MERALVFSTIFIILILIIYFYAFYIIVLKNGKKRRFLRLFYIAIINIFLLEESIESSYEQLKLDYEKLIQEINDSSFTSILDVLQTVIYSYDTYTKRRFKNEFGTDKNPNVRTFINSLCQYIINNTPFISLPQKEASLMMTIFDAIKTNNIDLGIKTLNQLETEIEVKESILKQKEKENKKAIFLSIVGIILTVFFGLMAFF